MSRKSIFLALSFLALVALALAACTPTEVVKTVVVTQEVQVAGTPVIQEVVVTATPEPVVATEAAPKHPGRLHGPGTRHSVLLRR